MIPISHKPGETIVDAILRAQRKQLRKHFALALGLGFALGLAVGFLVW